MKLIEDWIKTRLKIRKYRLKLDFIWTKTGLKLGKVGLKQGLVKD